MFDVIVVARYPTVRAGLTSVLEESDDFRVVAVAGEIEHAVRTSEEFMPDVVLIDLVEDALDLIDILGERASTGDLPPVVFLFPSVTDALNGPLISGVSLLLRDATPEEIRAALRAAAEGLVTMDPRIVSEIYRQLERGAYRIRSGESVTLTPREQDVLQRIARGLPNKAIARDLEISEHTVKFHIGSLFQKLEVSSRSEAIAVAARFGLLDL
jgi:two-component system, NarL family, response regulator YdfI